MSSQRILIVQEDQLLSKFYREQLETGGFVVQSVRTGHEAVQVVHDHHPDAVIIDSLTPGLEAADVVREIRSRPASRQIPIVALPSSRAPVARALRQAGAQVLNRVPNLPAELTDAVHTALGRERTGSIALCTPLQPNPRWASLSTAAAPGALNTMRHSVQSALREPDARQALRGLLQEVHGFTERLALFAQRPQFHFSAALEALVFELNRAPGPVNPSVLRTIGQAIDFCSLLVDTAQRYELHDLTTAHTLVVDDEDGAARIIMSALGLVGLSSLACDTPAGALSAVKAQTFDLIFLDVGLPSINGFELCNRIRNCAGYEQTPIVFVTGMGSFQNRVQSSLCGGNDFIGKPFNIPELGLKALMWLLKGQVKQV